MQPQSLQQPQNINQEVIADCFIKIHDPLSSPVTRRQANAFLLQSEKNFIQMMQILMSIFENVEKYGQAVRFQALLYLANIIKRNWNNKRILKVERDFPALKKHLSRKLIELLPSADRVMISSIYDIIKFIAKADYPHSFPQFTNFQMILMQNLEISDNFLKHFKELKQIYLQLSQRKGSVHIKNYQQTLDKIINGMGSLSQSFREEIMKNNGNVDANVCKLSKYIDQIILCVVRMAPYCLLDSQQFMMVMNHVMQKLKGLLAIHQENSTGNGQFLTSPIQKNLQKNIKSIIYLLGTLQNSNPCVMAPILSQYIQTIFFIVSKPQSFKDPHTIKYSLLSIRKFIKQFTYSSPNQLFLKSISSQQKSQNYLQLRDICHSVYLQFMNQETIEGLLNFLLTNIMNICEKGESGASSLCYGLDQEGSGGSGGLEKGQEKEVSVHIAGIMCVEAMVEKFPEKVLKMIFQFVQSCLESSWSIVDVPTQINFLSVISILPKTCRKGYNSYLQQFPIFKILQYLHSNPTGSPKLREKFPAIITGWVDIFSNQQISQLITVLLDYFSDVNTHMDLLLYCCFCLNKIVGLRAGAINIAEILHRIFPISIRIFSDTDSPEILWPMINLISSLITKCHFDTAMIVSSLQSNSFFALISNQSQMLIEALCEMFQNFLCVLPRNQPALALFQLIHTFLSRHLQKTMTNFHDKIVTLWYYSIRQFSKVNHECSKEYLQLFENCYRKCLAGKSKKQPVLIYILEEYMLLGLIQGRVQDYLQIVVDFYREGEFLSREADHQVSLQNNGIGDGSIRGGGNKEEAIQLKIAALSFQITLITRYNLQEVNSEQMLHIILTDFCDSQEQQQQQQQQQGLTKTTNNNNGGGSNVKMASSTLQNSLLSIINRYIIQHPDYFFNYLLNKFNIGNLQNFYYFYFRNIEHLTSRTATKINAIALISLLPVIPKQVSQGTLTGFLVKMFSHIVPEVDSYVKNAKMGELGGNVGRVDNSPVFRFSQSVLSERKEQIRKDSFVDKVNIQKFMIGEVEKLCGILGGNINQLAESLENAEQNLGQYFMTVSTNII